MSEPLDLRTPEERAKDAEIEALLQRCESSLVLSAFTLNGFENPSTLEEIRDALGLPDTPSAKQVLSHRISEFLRRGSLVQTSPGRYKVDLTKWQSKLRGT
jgi:hypothetical protein